MQFRGRQVLMITVLAVLMLPAVATIAPLFIMLNKVQIGDFNLRQSLLGVAFAVISGLLPFAIWNLKGYLDTIPKDLEEAAAVDGATRNQSFIKVVLPLAVPALAVTAFLGFIAGWTEFYFSVTFLRDPNSLHPLGRAQRHGRRSSRRPPRGASSARSRSCSRCPCRSSTSSSSAGSSAAWPSAA